MSNVIEIDDPDDPRLGDYLHLTDAQLRRAAEIEEGFFIAESVQVVRRLLGAAHEIRSVLVTPARFEQLAGDLVDREVTVYVAPQEVLNRVAGFNLHRGAVAAAHRLPEPSLTEALGAARTVAILEGLNDHENLGVIFRSAHALGVDLVLLDPTCADPYYRRTVRVSMGAVLVLPFVRLTDWPAALERVRSAGFRLLAFTPSPDARPIDEAVVGGGRSALLFGAEGPGLRPETLALADERVRIPLRAGTDSLNVGHAAAIAFHRFGGGEDRSPLS